MNKSIMITGANAGIGKELAKQVALLEHTEKVYLACRNIERAEVAKKELEKDTGRSVFQIVIMDVSQPESVIKVVSNLLEPIDALVMNAGGMGGKTPLAKNKVNSTSIFAVNVLGHAVLMDELLKAGKLKKVALYAGSEAARGVAKMGLNKPHLKTSSVEEFTSIINGSYFKTKKEVADAYGLVKYMAALWMSSLARKNPNIKFITMSPGGTKGTNVLNDMPFIQKIIFKHIVFPYLMPLMGMAHSVETAAKRFVKGISDNSLQSGVFYGSKEKTITGPVIDQSALFADLNDQVIQDNAYKAIHKFIK